MYDLGVVMGLCTAVLVEMLYVCLIHSTNKNVDAVSSSADYIDVMGLIHPKSKSMVHEKKGG